MPFKPGQSGNPSGISRVDKQAITKIRKAIAMGIDNMIDGKVVGVVALASKITAELNACSTPSKILKDLAPLLPKDLYVESVSQNSADKLSDSELADIIAKRARQKHLDNQTLEGECETLVDLSDSSKTNGQP